MEIHQLRYFYAIVKQGTFTRAAESEHVSQPSLSQQILKLEDELGGKLFYRLPREARLTPLGKSFLPHALTILQQIRDSKAEARKIVERRRSPVDFEVTPITAGQKPQAVRNGQELAEEHSLTLTKIAKSA